MLGFGQQRRLTLGNRLAGGAIRVLKQWRGHSGIGVWRVQRAPGHAAFGGQSLVLAKHAPRDSAEVTVSFDEFADLMAPYFESGGHMIDQAWQPRLTEGMIRCYLVQDRVVGFGLQAVNALYPPVAGDGSADTPTPSQRLYYPPDLPHGQVLRRRLETEWLPELGRTLAIARDELPLLWDCDFLQHQPEGVLDEKTCDLQEADHALIVPRRSAGPRSCHEAERDGIFAEHSVQGILSDDPRSILAARKSA